MLLFKVRRLLASLFVKADKTTILIAILGYVAGSYLLLSAAGESEIIAPENFIYWLVVTASTVGYGDFSPVSPAGKVVVATWVIPFGLSLFAMLITRVGFAISEFVHRGKRGLRMTNNVDHTVIIGWNGTRTLRLIELLLSKTNGTTSEVVLCVEADIENPMPGKIDFVRVESFSHIESMQRTGLAEAARIIIDNPLDDVTLTTALFCDKHSPNSHKTAYFQDENVGELLRAHCPNIECIPSVAVELLAKSSLDPGSARLHRQLLDSTYGMTQYSVEYRGEEPLPFGALFDHFKQNLSATLIAVRPRDVVKIDVNPALTDRVGNGDMLYYISAKRLDEKRCFDIKIDEGEGAGTCLPS
ncbi:potassium channel family protein [Microbulbifer sp. GL-2]|uniref:potassium channel family protein n=1 Tax=Microbulbifer sp. GL-2 TaxID=2591606 RepID=UPI001164BA78|nr:potassium channel family protein [Microbulbifer sp. GL-2]BBM02911.1 potassium channel protein [Microbulbifer sp. GL-2]